MTSQGSREQSDLKTKAEAGIIIVTLTCSEIVRNQSRKINSLQVKEDNFLKPQDLQKIIFKKHLFSFSQLQSPISAVLCYFFPRVWNHFNTTGYVIILSNVKMG